jgi:uncharacterized protein YprB with RNaseH-like and TPR domain
MIKNTFCHIPGIGTKSERQLWDNGLVSWQTVNKNSVKALSRKRKELLLRYAEESTEQLSAGNPRYFNDLLPANQAWRLFPDFENSVAYLDIETTGLRGDRDYVTTIALYDGLDVYHYVRGENLDEFADRIAAYKLIVTYNGKTFDVPFLRTHLGLPMTHAHIDLRYVLASLGQTGGLKACEKRLGLDREDLADVDGYFAVLLWHDYIRNKNRKSLETLLAYNIADVVNLAIIMPMAYNMKIQDTPFHQSHTLPLVTAPDIPFKADRATIERIKSAACW